MDEPGRGQPRGTYSDEAKGSAGLPGECATGKLEAGTTARFQVETPNLGQKFEIHIAGDNRRNGKLAVEIGKNGQPTEPKGDAQFIDELGSGTYTIALRAPPTDSKYYVVKSYWGWDESYCPIPHGWRDTMEASAGQE